jgi:hypothetical protein
MEDAPTLLRHARAPRACNLVRSGARVPFPTRVVGGGSRSAEQPGRRESRGFIGPGRGEGGEGEHGIVRTACEGDSQGIGGRVSAGLGTSRRQTCHFGAENRSRWSNCRARGKRAEPEVVGAPTVRGTHPPACAREWVSYEANLGISCRFGSGVGALPGMPRVARCEEWAMRSHCG